MTSPLSDEELSSAVSETVSDVNKMDRELKLLTLRYDLVKLYRDHTRDILPKLVG